jgi:hypothetical protein
VAKQSGKSRFSVIGVQLPKSGPGWGVYDAKEKQVINTGQSRVTMQEWADAMDSFLAALKEQA